MNAHTHIIPAEEHRADTWHIRSDFQGYSLWHKNTCVARLYGMYLYDCKPIADALIAANLQPTKQPGYTMQ